MIIKSLLEQRVFKIKINGKFSKYFNDPSGVPQGSSIACLLFSIYINDIGEFIKSTFYLYADDEATIVVNTDPKIIVQTLQQDLQNINLWCNKNLISLNENKN
jgi:hypothetical protein